MVSLFRQSTNPSLIVLVTTHHDEGDQFRIWAELDGVSKQMRTVYKQNKPLGAKWQSGIDSFFNRSPQHNDDNQLPNTLIITGSDDILGDGFIENACRLVEQGNHFIGLRQWYQHKDGKAYKCQYMAKNNFPLGGGRVYSAEMLRAMNYQVFDPTKDRHLDDLGWANAQKTGLKCLVLDDPEKEGLSIHAIKGNWEVMNKFTINHPNIKLLSTEKSQNVLPSFFK